MCRWKPRTVPTPDPAPEHPKSSGIPCDTCKSTLHWSERGGVLPCPVCDYPGKATP